MERYSQICLRLLTTWCFNCKTCDMFYEITDCDKLCRWQDALTAVAKSRQSD